ncbi:DUF924 family protein [Leptolyngbya sp. NIES-2104]|uniref:DUF924 family protein n=1 Tax=Leptolyngbya sp. NIES-2104 TaxID=1552121 RepID=UPI0006EC7E2F|nr:DUF924 family protein [Leptolyngbya sp. NIES-2104]GAP98557.1 putative transmembrane protein [Leptolyngbya sp. NIES-2104]
MNATEVLSFWFGDKLEMRKVWFVKNSDFDTEVRSRFLPLYEQAASDQFDGWIDSPESCLALIIVLDQFPRNMFRGTPRSFATDSKALKIAKRAIAQKFDQQVPPIQRFFFYLPLEHSENLDDQNESVRLYEQFRDSPELKETYDYAIRHRDVIERFERFPHRNQILDRPSTPEEIEFLKQPGSSF